MLGVAIIAAWFCLAATPASELSQADAALAEFKIEAALRHLANVEAAGSLSYADHLRLYEDLGIAHAYRDHRELALAAFDLLLALDPGHALSYTLSPKVTFLFELARASAGQLPVPAVTLSWQRDLKVGDPIDVDVEVLADRKGFLQRGRLYHRRGGTDRYQEARLVMPLVGSYQRVRLTEAAFEATSPQVVQLYLVVEDARGNEVLLVGEAKRPREIPLAYEAPVPWYGRWWVWAVAGGVATIAAGAIVFQGTYQPPDKVGGTFERRP